MVSVRHRVGGELLSDVPLLSSSFDSLRSPMVVMMLLLVSLAVVDRVNGQPDPDMPYFGTSGTATIYCNPQNNAPWCQQTGQYYNPSQAVSCACSPDVWKNGPTAAISQKQFGSAAGDQSTLNLGIGTTCSFCYAIKPYAAGDGSKCNDDTGLVSIVKIVDVCPSQTNQAWCSFNNPGGVNQYGGTVHFDLEYLNNQELVTSIFGGSYKVQWCQVPCTCWPGYNVQGRDPLAASWAPADACPANPAGGNPFNGCAASCPWQRMCGSSSPPPPPPPPPPSSLPAIQSFQWVGTDYASQSSQYWVGMRILPVPDSVFSSHPADGSYTSMQYQNSGGWIYFQQSINPPTYLGTTFYFKVYYSGSFYVISSQLQQGSTAYSVMYTG